MKEFDLTPDPKVLIALTHTPLQPLDALCELIDNALDSFTTANLEGNPVEFPLVAIDLPGRSEVDRGEGTVRIRDNGTGLTAEMAEQALRAGYSSNNPFDRLGLFGMGFNISSGKLGRVTRFLTARKDDPQALEVIIDLVKLQESRHYKVPVSLTDKPVGFTHGTIIEVTGWWPEGNPNVGFIRKLASYGRAAVRHEIGKRYATILRGSKTRILINADPCEAFEHCGWDRIRFVDRKGHGKIPAVFDFDQAIAVQHRCSACGNLVSPPGSACANCGSASFRTIEERIGGWVGIQRFDHPTDFGIDLIRRGRAIRIAEKAAFFEFTDEFKKTIRDYPIDSPFGRIVGEVHLDHVPVDFLKQDFQRSSEEWQKAIIFLRGDSSLQPNQPNADRNTSPIFKLYQGYRRVRVAGRTDMYMGYWDRESEGPKRISRDIEREYHERFKAKEPGFYEDAEWWKLVEQADQRPLEELEECSACSAQNLKGSELCQVCGEVLIGKICLNRECSKKVAQSAAICPHCGTSQRPEIREPWTCKVCGQRNPSDAEGCERCASSKDAKSPTSREYLLANSDKEDSLCIPGCSVSLADGGHSLPIEVDTYVTRAPIIPEWQGAAVPSVVFKGERIELFLDRAHPIFRSFRTAPQLLIATEVAQYLYDANRRLLSQHHQGAHTLSNLIWQIVSSRWAEVLEDSPEHIKDDIRDLFGILRSKLSQVDGNIADELFESLSDNQKKALVANMLDQALDITELGTMKRSGRFLTFVDNDTVVDVFRRMPRLFFDGLVWDVAYQAIRDLPDAVVEDARSRIMKKYLNCLEDSAAFLTYQGPETVITQRARASVDFLGQKLE